MAFRETRKNNGYDSLFVKVILTYLGGAFFRTRCISKPSSILCPPTNWNL